MANVIGVLWHAQTRDPLITPGRVPIAHERIRASALYPLDPAFSAVVDSEVDGDGSLPSRMEANPSRRISQLRAATRSARAVFLSEIADWFAAYVYLPKLRDRVVLESSIRDAVAKFDAQFGYADGFDDVTEKYRKLIWAKNPPELVSPTALLVREAEARRQLSEEGAPGPALGPGSPPAPEPQPGTPGPVTEPTPPGKPRRFYGSVEIDMVRPVKSFDAILTAVVMELQRTQGAKVKLTLEIEAEATGGFDDSEVSVVRDNAQQLKFKPESTGFEE